MLVDDMKKPFPVRPRPVNDKGLSFDGFLRHVSPGPAVPALIAVVSHDEIGVRRNRDRAEARRVPRISAPA